MAKPAATKIEVGQKDGASPKAKVDALVAGQRYPFGLHFTNTHKRPLVVASANHGDVVNPGEEVVFTINSYEQAWGVVMDVAGMAETMRKDVLGTFTAAVGTASGTDVEAKQ